jgi:hypothetical protein
VPHYDVYAASGEGGRLPRVYSFTAADDSAAERFVMERLTEKPVELWCHSRRVASYAGKDSS